MRDLLGRLQESTVDFPQEDLEPQIWDYTGDGYVLKPEVKSQIMEYIQSYPGPKLLPLLGELHIIGSICTNLYGLTTDIDVHIVPDMDKLGAITSDAEEFQKEVKTWSHENPVYVGEHPIELYIQLLPEQEMLSDGVYNVQADTWEKGPKIYPMEYNPYKVFSDVLDRIREFGKKADVDMGELRRDLIDYSVVRGAMDRLPKEYKTQLMSELTDKLKELESDIDELLKDKKEWVDLRRNTSRPTPQQALQQTEVAKQWGNANAIFKFLDRYDYIRMISTLEKMLADDKLSDDELAVMQNMFGVE